MKIVKDCYVTIKYTLALDSGEVVDSTPPEADVSFIAGASQIMPGLDAQLMGMDEGQEAEVIVEPDDAYGPYDERLVRELPRTNFPDDLELKPGMAFQSELPHGSITFLIRSVGDDVVEVDFNHPLAGKRLHFNVEVVTVREATEEELEQARKAAEEAACHSCGCTCDDTCDNVH